MRGPVLSGDKLHNRATLGRVPDHTRHTWPTALCSVLTPDMFCSKPGQVSMTVGARGRAGYIPSQYNTKTKSSPGGILPVPVKTKKSISRPDLVITSRRSQNSAQISSLGNVKANVIYHGHDQSELQASDACLPLLNTDLCYVTVPSWVQSSVCHDRLNGSFRGNSYHYAQTAWL